MTNKKALEILAREVRPLSESEAQALIAAALNDKAFI